MTCEQYGRDEHASCQRLYLVCTLYFCLPRSCTAPSTQRMQNIAIVTRSHPEVFPSPLRQKGKTRTNEYEMKEVVLKVRLTAHVQVRISCGVHWSTTWRQARFRLTATR